jgi:hypothetical protein
MSQSSSESISAVGLKYLAKLKSSGSKTAACNRSLGSAQQRTQGHIRTIESSTDAATHFESPSARNRVGGKRKILDPGNQMSPSQAPSANLPHTVDTHNYQGMIVDIQESPPRMRRRILDLSMDSPAPRSQSDELLSLSHSKAASPESFLSSSSPSQPSMPSSSHIPSSITPLCSIQRKSPVSNTSLPTPTPPRADPRSSTDMDFRSLCSPVDDVCDFVKAVCRQVFPLEAVWGTRHNLSGFLAAVDR